MQTFVKELCVFRKCYVDTTSISIISELTNDVAKKIQGHLGTCNTKAVSPHDFTLHLRIFETLTISTFILYMKILNSLDCGIKEN